MSTPGAGKPEHANVNAIGILALLFWASSLPFTKRCSEELGPMTTGAIQYLVSGVLAFLLLSWRSRGAGRAFLKNPEFLKRNALFVAYFVLLFSAIGLVSRDNLPFVTLLNYLWPTFTMMLSVMMLGQRFRPLVMGLGILAVATGLTVEILGEDVFRLMRRSDDLSTLFGYGAAASGAVVWGFYTVLNRRWGPRAGEATALPFLLLTTALCLFILRFVFGEETRFSPDVLPPLAYLSVMPFLANLCWDVGTRRGNIVVLSLLADGLPWASLMITRIYLGVDIPARSWLSAFLIVSGALLSRVSLLLAQKADESGEKLPEPRL